MNRRLSHKVAEFINQCANYISNDWKENLINECIEYCETTSPIEHLLYCAIWTLAKLNSITMRDTEPMLLKKDNGEYDEFVRGVDILPQYKIGKYRVDFLIIFYEIDWYIPKQIKREIIVECDSQQFHERTEQERRYEKERDRFLIKKGYEVFHYTGKQIMENPLAVASEILSHITKLNLGEV